MTQEEIKDLLKFIICKCDLVINNENYTADEYAQDKIEDIAEMCHRVLDGQFGETIETSKSSIPSNLDEAAEEYGRKEYSHAIHFWDEGLSKNKPEVMKEDFVNSFKAGAEWMAGQGQSRIAEICSNGIEIDCGDGESCFSNTLKSAFEKFNDGDKVVVQIRKK